MSEFTLAILGLDDREERVVKSVYTLSETRRPSFKPYAFSRATPADILIMDADNPRAVEAWQVYRRLHEAEPDPPVILLAKEKLADLPGNYNMCPPLSATRLLALLEKVAVRDLDYVTQSMQPDDDDADASGAEVAASPAPSAGGQNVQNASTGVKALVVDDSLPVRIQMKIALQNVTSDVDFAENGEQGLELLTQHRYDIVFLDVILPGVDGYDLCKTIKQDPAKSDTPVIMLTSNSAPADRAKGKLAGCDTYLIKPLNKAVFEEVVREFLTSPAAA